MAGPSKRKILEQAEPRCRDCRHWRIYDDAEAAVGACYLAPPKHEYGDDGCEYTSRPTLEADEFACGSFSPKQ